MHAVSFYRKLNIEYSRYWYSRNYRMSTDTRTVAIYEESDYDRTPEFYQLFFSNK